MATVKELQAEKDKNSAAWRGAATQTEKDRLHQANKDLQSQIDSVTGGSSSFNPGNGTWTSTPGTTLPQPPTQTAAAPTAAGGNLQRGAGSANGVGVNSDQQWIKDQMNANSQAWANATTQEQKDKLHQDNVNLQGMLGGSVSFDPGTGTWSGSAAAPTKPQNNGGDFDYISAMYAEKQKAALAALRAAYEKNVSGLDRAQASVAPQYQDARNEAAGQAELQKRNFAEYAAANGLNSGAGGQAQLSFSNALQGNLGDIAAKEASTLADLELQRTQMGTDYENAIAQAKAQGNYELAQQLYAEKVRQDELMLQEMQFKAQQELQNQQLQFNKDQAAIGNEQWDKNFQTGNEQWDKQWAQKQAEDLAQHGDYSGYKALGYSDEQIANMKALSDGSGQGGKVYGGGGGTGPSKPTLTYAQMVSALERGELTPGVLAAYEYYNQTPYKEQGQEGGGPQAGMDPGVFSGLVNQIQSMVRSGGRADAAALFDRNQARLSQQQLAELAAILGI